MNNTKLLSKILRLKELKVTWFRFEFANQTLGERRQASSAACRPNHGDGERSFRCRVGKKGLTYPPIGISPEFRHTTAVAVAWRVYIGLSVWRFSCELSRVRRP